MAEKEAALETATGEAATQAQSLQGELESRQGRTSPPRPPKLEQALAAQEQLAKEREDAIAERESAPPRSADLLKMVDDLTTEKGKLTTEKDQLAADLEGLKTQLETAAEQGQSLETLRAGLETELQSCRPSTPPWKKSWPTGTKTRAEAQANLDALTQEKGSLTEEMQAALQCQCGAGSQPPG